MSSVAAHNRNPSCQRHRAKHYLEQGRALLEAGAHPQAKAAFAAATRLSADCAPIVVDCYDALGDTTDNRKLALHCHRQAKRYCKDLRRAQGACEHVSQARLGRTLLGLAEQYTKLSHAKTYNEHDTNRAIGAFAQALDHVDNIDRPAVYRGRLDASIAWLAQKRGPFWFGGKRLACERRCVAWEDALLLLRAPPWDPAQSSAWEAVADLARVCADPASGQTVVQRVVPLLQGALWRAGTGLGHGNPWLAAQALLGQHKSAFGAIFDAMRQAVARDTVSAEQLPAVLAAYDRALALKPTLALDAAADLPVLRARFWQQEHAMGNLVFTSGRFLEAAQKAGDKVMGAHALAAIAQVTEHTPGQGAPHTAIVMLGYVAKRLPDYGVPAIERLLHLLRACAKKSLAADAALPQAIVDTLQVCCKKPAPKAVRRAAQAGCESLAALGLAGFEAGG